MASHLRDYYDNVLIGYTKNDKTVVAMQAGKVGIDAIDGQQYVLCKVNNIDNRITIATCVIPLCSVDMSVLIRSIKEGYFLRYYFCTLYSQVYSVVKLATQLSVEFLMKMQ